MYQKLIKLSWFLKTFIADFYQSVKKGKKIIEGRLFYFN